MAIKPTVWTAPSLTRVSQTANPLVYTNKIKIYAARGEVESFQVIVRAPRGGLTNVNLEITQLSGANSAIIPKSAFTLYREHYIQVIHSSVQDGSAVKRLPAGWYPDALIPFVDPATGVAPQNAELKAVPVNLPAGTNQPFWIDVTVPRDASAGIYRGEFKITSDQGQAKGNLTLQVWNFELPVQPALKSIFQFWPLVNRYADEELLRHKLMPLVVFEPERERSYIDNLGLNCTNLNFWGAVNASGTQMNPPPSLATLNSAVATHPPDLYLYNYTADEIDGYPSLYPTLKAWARNLHQAGAKQLITMQPVPELMDDGSDTGSSAVDIWVLLPNMYEAAKTNVATVLEKGDEVWSYNCLVQDNYSPKWLVDYEPINFRIQPGFINQRLGLTGLLYWNVAAWNNDPWATLEYVHYENYYNGEGMMVYPGAKAGLSGVAPSMRLKWLRDGVEDYEYINLLKAFGYGTWAANVVKNVATDWHTWTRDPEVLYSNRIQLGNKLEQIMNDL